MSVEEKLDTLIDLFTKLVSSLPAAVPVVMFYDWLTEYMTLYKRPVQTDKTYMNNLARITHYIKPCIPDKPLKNVTTTELQELLKSHEEHPNAQKKLFILLNGCFRKAIACNKISFNPCGAVVLTKYETQSYPVIQPAAQTQILNAAKSKKYRAFFLFCCCTGMRVSEALSIKKTDIDFFRNVINISMSDTATKKHKRSVPFLPWLIPTSAEMPDGYLFQGMTYNSLKLYFKRLFTTLKIDAVLHSFRHTFISCCYHVGIKEKQIQLWVGHRSITTTMDTYTHIMENENSLILDYLRQLKKACGVLELVNGVEPSTC